MKQSDRKTPFAGRVGLFWSSRAPHGCSARVGAGARLAPPCHGSLHHPLRGVRSNHTQKRSVRYLGIGDWVT